MIFFQGGRGMVFFRGRRHDMLRNVPPKRKMWKFPLTVREGGNVRIINSIKQINK